MKTCNYTNPNFGVKCNLPPKHLGDHTFTFPTHPRDIEHDHEWILVYSIGYDPFGKVYEYRRLVDTPPDKEYYCKVCNRKRLEYK